MEPTLIVSYHHAATARGSFCAAQLLAMIFAKKGSTLTTPAQD
jgi:hypothetical protein